MIDLIKKFGTYFAATITFLIAIKTSFGISADWKCLAILSLSLGVACATI